MTVICHGVAPSSRTVEILPGVAPSYTHEVLQELLDLCLINGRAWDELPAATRNHLSGLDNTDELLEQLVEHRQLTPYQASRIKAGTIFGLILGNYRVLDCLGSGGMGVVYKAEHLRLPRLVAIKVLPMSPGQNPKLLQRFDAEMGAVSQLQHPNIVGAIDAGEAVDSTPNAPHLHYFVMDYVPGETLDDKVRRHGPLSATAACDLAHQLASALAEAHQRQLVHRDIKPSNVIVTPEGQAKLLDFGLAHQHGADRITEPGTALGTLDFVAPEQAQDARTADIRSDIFSLGATLFWCLTGRLPFGSHDGAVQSLIARLKDSPPNARAWRPDLPAGLENVVAQMMASERAQRPATPQAVMQLLVPFLQKREERRWGSDSATDSTLFISTAGLPSVHQVLIVDDDAMVRDLCRYLLQADGVRCDEAANGREALERLQTQSFDLILCDIDMPEMSGPELLKQLRQHPPGPHLKIIMFSGRASGDEMAHMVMAGADDYLTKPLSLVQLRSRVQSALRLKDAQDQADMLNRQLSTANAELERNLTARDSDLIQARNALVLALAEMASYRGSETGAHLLRIQNYCRYLLAEAAPMRAFTGQLDAHTVQLIECCAPLHDIGTVGLPDHLLAKPGRLDAAERIIMQTHTTIGAETLRKVAARHGFAAGFLRIAEDIVRHHHERYDGKGYPDRLVGSQIPLCARVVTVADVYDALRSRRTYKPPLSHEAALQVMTEASPGQFDPQLIVAFQRCASEFERIAREMGD